MFASMIFDLYDRTMYRLIVCGVLHDIIWISSIGCNDVCVMHDNKMWSLEGSIWQVSWR